MASAHEGNTETNELASDNRVQSNRLGDGDLVWCGLPWVGAPGVWGMGRVLMKKITLIFPDDSVLGELNSALNVKGLCGNAYGILDAFMVRLLKGIERGDVSWNVVKKTEEAGG